MTIKQKIALLLNLASAGFQFYCTIFSCITRGLSGFQYYTLDSNIFAGISSILLVIFLLTTKAVPAWVHKLRYFGTCCVTVTFVVVITLLVPMAGWNTFSEMMFHENNLWMHTVCPLLCIFSFLFLEQEHTLKTKDVFLSIVPTIIYAIIAITLNVLGILDGPYFFLRVQVIGVLKVIMWIFVVSIIVFLISFLLKLGNEKLRKKA